MAPATREAAPVEEVEALRQKQLEQGTANIFQTLAHDEEEINKRKTVKKQKPTPTESRHQTALFKISRRKLNDLGRQISGKPIDSAILQMVFSEKRASEKVKHLLGTAKASAVQKGLKVDRLVVSEAWVNKGKTMKRIEFKGRGKVGIREHPHARMKIILREGKTEEQKERELRDRKLKRIISAGLVREDIPIRNPGAAWAW